MMKSNAKLGKLRKPVTGFLAACLLVPVVGYAAPPDAGQTLQEMQQTERKLPDRQMPKLEGPTEATPPANSQNALKVFVKGYRVTGQDVFPAGELEALLSSFQGKEITYDEMQQAAQRVTKYFREQGYFVAQAYLPPQQMEGGMVEIAVLVGRFGDIIIKNQSAVQDNIVRMQLASLVPGNYVRTAQLERAALLCDDLSGAQAKLTLTPGKKTGTTDVIIEVKNQGSKTSGSLSFNNWGNRFSGANQVNANLYINNAIGWGDSAAAMIGSAGSGQKTGSVNWRLPVGEGQQLNFGFSKLNYELGQDFAYLNASGTATTYSAGWSYALLRSRSSNLNFQAGYAYKQLEDFVVSNSTYKRSHALSFGFTGDSSDSLWGGGANAYEVTWYHGGIFGDSNLSTLPPAKWEKTTFSLLRQQYVADRLSFFLSFSGQTASTNLDSSERFVLGGANAVRAYPSGEASGDEAWLLTGEMRWTLPAFASENITQLVAFYDTGTSHIEKNPSNPSTNRRSISGAGLGVNYICPGDYLIKAYYAWKTGAEASRSDNDKGGRFWLQAVKFF